MTMAALLSSALMLILLLSTPRNRNSKVIHRCITSQGTELWSLGKGNAVSSQVLRDLPQSKFHSSRRWLFHSPWSSDSIEPPSLYQKKKASIPEIVRKQRRSKRPCLYYANTKASFHLPLDGNLVFKLNPGPVNDQNTANQNHQKTTSKSIHYGPLSLCLMNAQSIRCHSDLCFP